ncbi:MAG: O-antigen ligase family protein, partial [Candidatus Magnetoovum sp. WYHC-5]|nr:O-antigen ligase family protein [Candidatus Magnetoovum sp. WYHC-5]
DGVSTIVTISIYMPAIIWLINSIKNKTVGVNLKEPIFLALIGLSLSGLVSSAVNYGFVDAIILFKKTYLKMLIIYLIVVYGCSTLSRLERVAFVMAASGVIYMLAAFYAVAKDLVTTGYIDYFDIRYYATVLLFYSPFIFLQVLNHKGRVKTAWVAAVIGVAVVLVMTGVRTSWVAFFVILGFWATLTKKTITLSMAVKTVSVIFLITIIIFISFPSQYKLVRGHLFQTTQLTLRFEAWRNFVDMATTKLYLGYGQDDEVMALRYSEYFSTVNGRLPSKTEPMEPTSPHNQFIKMFYQQGGIGMLLYAVVLLCLYVRLGIIMYHKRHASIYLIALCLVLSITGEYFIRIMFEDRSLIPYSLLIGMVGALTNINTVYDNTKYEHNISSS